MPSGAQLLQSNIRFLIGLREACATGTSMPCTVILGKIHERKTTESGIEPATVIFLNGHVKLSSKYLYHIITLNFSQRRFFLPGHLSVWRFIIKVLRERSQTLSLKQDIFTNPAKAQGPSWKRRWRQWKSCKMGRSAMSFCLPNMMWLSYSWAYRNHGYPHNIKPAKFLASKGRCPPRPHTLPPNSGSWLCVVSPTLLWNLPDKWRSCWELWINFFDSSHEGNNHNIKFSGCYKFVVLPPMLPLLTPESEYNCQPRKAWNEIFQALTVNNCQPRLLYSMKLSFAS